MRTRIYNQAQLEELLKNQECEEFKNMIMALKKSFPRASKKYRWVVIRGEKKLVFRAYSKTALMKQLKKIDESSRCLEELKGLTERPKSNLYFKTMPHPTVMGIALVLFVVFLILEAYTTLKK